eukprot:3157512-Amphidinium_carterae.1
MQVHFQPEGADRLLLAWHVQDNLRERLGGITRQERVARCRHMQCVQLPGMFPAVLQWQHSEFA